MDSQLKDFFLCPESYSHPVSDLRHLETHISDIFLTGVYAYKVKKALRLDFLDFSTLERRRFFCEREVLRGRQFAPELYEGVLSVWRMDGELRFGGADVQADFADHSPFGARGKPIEAVIQMKQLDEKSLFTDLIAAGKLTTALLIDVTRQIARFHKQAELMPHSGGFEQVHRWSDENFQMLQAHSPAVVPAALLDELRSALEKELTKQERLIRTRQSSFVKALHGDLHLRNLALLRGRPIIFDGIEFNDELACCDVWADLAFLTMDLRYRQNEAGADTVVSCYLNETQDEAGLPLLRLYEAYRALVRAKVSCIELSQDADVSRRQHAVQSVVQHAELARRILLRSEP